MLHQYSKDQVHLSLNIKKKTFLYNVIHNYMSRKMCQMSSCALEYLKRKLKKGELVLMLKSPIFLYVLGSRK